MSEVKGSFPQFKGIMYEPQFLTPDAVDKAVIADNAKVVVVSTVTNDANDWIVLPELYRVPNGHEITILCNAGGNFEMRTPINSTNKINNVDSSDNAVEYLCTDTYVIYVVKIDDTIGWMAHDYTQIGTVVAAHTPN